MAHKFDPARRARLQGPERARLLPPEDLLRQAGLGTGMRLADVGCGPGFFALPAAHIVGPAGRVYAIDISQDLLREVREQADAERLAQIWIVQSAESAIPLPDAAADMALMAFVLHEAVHPAAFVREVVRILSPSGRLILLEWNKEEMPMGPPVRDRLDPEVSEAFLIGAGLTPVKRFAPNPYHYGIIAVREPLVLHATPLEVWGVI